MAEAAVQLDDGMTDAERHFFQSGGDVSDALLTENKTPAEQPAPPPGEPAPNVEAAPGEQPIDEEIGAEEGDEGAQQAQPGQTDQQQQQQQAQRQRRRVSMREYQAAQERAAAAEKQLQERAVQQARIEERLNILQQALQEPAQTQQQQEEDPRPDPEQDIFGYAAWLERRFNAMHDKVTGYERQITEGQAEMDAERRYFDSLNNYAGSHPDFVNAYNTALRGRAAQLIGEQYGDQVTDEQLAGIRDGSIRIPQAISDTLRQEERSLYKSAFESNRDPAAILYRYAQSFGYVPAAQRTTIAVPNGPHGSPLVAPPLGGAQPAAAASQAQPAATNGAAQPQAQPSATDVVTSIQRGQRAAQSLSNVGGSSVDTQLTPEALANMSEAQFEALYNELMAKGDRGKLMDLFGH